MDTAMQALQYQNTHFGGLVMLWGTPATPTAIRTAGKYYNISVGDSDNRFVYTTYNTSWAAIIDDAFLDAHIAFHPMFMRIEWDGTNLIFKASPSGIAGTYVQVTSQAEGLGRPDHVGVGVNNNAAATASIAAYNFFRFGWTADFDPTLDN